MKQRASFSAELLHLCGQHRDQALTDAQADRLSTIIVEQPEARQFYVNFMTIAGALEARLPKQAEQPEDTASDESVDLLLELLQMEQQAVGQLAHPVPINAKPSSSEEMLALLKDAGAVKELAGYAIRSKPAKWFAAAAAVLLGLSLLIVVYTRGDVNDTSTTATPVATQTPDNTDEPAAEGLAVARLTAQTSAKWNTAKDSAVPVVGGALYSGQRFSLTHGFAEVTTSRGAVARIQAPATFELTDNDNAIRLHRGKMLGICEIESSKGFLVRTPHMDITDLGTRFGVDATASDATEVHVIEGEVRVARRADDGTRIEKVLTASQAVAASEDTRVLTMVEPDLTRFASIDQPPAPDHIQQITGALRPVPASGFIGQPSALWPTSSDACLFHEFTGRLATDIQADLVEPGNYQQIPSSEVQDKRIPAGTAVHSYILFKNQDAAGQTNQLLGSVTFDREVIGIMIQQATADQFSQAIASAQVFTPGVEGWINIDSQDDALVLSLDRRTVHFAFETGQAPDTIRVLLREEEAAKQP